jgi:hypothetical protein
MIGRDEFPAMKLTRQLIAPLIVVLAFVNVQCAALCSTGACPRSSSDAAADRDQLPPCHHHEAPGHRESGQRETGSCPHQSLPVMDVDPVAQAVPVLAPAPSAVLPFVALAVSLHSDLNVVPARAPSPPGHEALASIILRI